MYFFALSAGTKRPHLEHCTLPFLPAPPFERPPDFLFFVKLLLPRDFVGNAALLRILHLKGLLFGFKFQSVSLNEQNQDIL